MRYTSLSAERRYCDAVQPDRSRAAVIISGTAQARILAATSRWQQSINNVFVFNIFTFDVPRVSSASTMNEQLLVSSNKLPEVDKRPQLTFIGHCGRQDDAFPLTPALSLREREKHPLRVAMLDVP